MNRSSCCILRSCRIARRSRERENSQGLCKQEHGTHLGASRTFANHRFGDVLFDELAHFEFDAFFHLVTSKWNMVGLVAQSEIESGVGNERRRAAKLYRHVSFIHSGFRQRNTLSSGLSTITAYGQYGQHSSPSISAEMNSDRWRASFQFGG